MALAPATRPTTRRHTWRAMTCRAEVLVVTPDGAPDAFADALVARAVGRVAELEGRWSRFLPGSEISRLNLAAGSPCTTSADTVRLVVHLVQAARATGGAFDPTLLPALVALGYEASWDDRRCSTMLPPGARVRGDVEGVLVDEMEQLVQLPRGTTLDPGGLGKGLAADLVAAELIAAGATGALVNLGGDVRVVGCPAGGEACWSIAVAGNGSGTARVRLAEGAVATSGTRWRSWDTAGARRHHLLDPRTAEPCATAVPSRGDLVAATVVAASAAWAEAWTKAVFVLGPDTALRPGGALDMHGLGGRAVLDDGSTITNESWELYSS